MKFIIYILLSFSAFKYFAVTTPVRYYISANGNNTTGTSPATAWTSISKLNSSFASINPGDSILFNRGETFYGTVMPTKGGVAGAPIVLGSYGTGSKPVIKETVALSGWTNNGGGIWTSSTNSTLLSSLKIVLINGVITHLGRYPNLSATNKGWLSQTSGTQTTITANSLPASPTWVGADISVRIRSWIIDRRTVTSRSGSVLTLGSSLSYAPYSGYGYFFENHMATLDTYGEWAYNNAGGSTYKFDGTAVTVPAKSVSMYFGSVNPNTLTVEASNADRGFDIGYSYIDIIGLSIVGANNDAIKIANGKNHINVTDCNIYASGYCGINGDAGSVSSCKSIRNTIDYSYTNGVLFYGNDDMTRSCTITNSGTIAGVGAGGDGQSMGIKAWGNNHIVDSNVVINSGYTGIYYQVGNNTVIKYNLVDSFAFIKDDVSGIYTFNTGTGKTPVEYYGNVVDHNIISNGIGAPEGTGYSPLAMGLYYDGKSRGTTATNNTIININGFGVQWNNNRNVILRNNTFYNTASVGQHINSYDSATTNSAMNGSNQFVGNIQFSANSTDRLLLFDTKFYDVGNFGRMDSNYWCRPLSEPSNVISGSGTTFKVTHGSTLYYSLDRWSQAYGYDIHSKKTAKTITNISEVLPLINKTFSPQTFTLNGKTYIDVKGNSYKTGSLILQAFESVILLVTPNVPLDNSTNNYPNVAITAPANNTTLTQPINQTITASASDIDGTVTKVDFYNGSTFLGTDNTSPYSFTWNSIPVGKYSLTAKATDNLGAVTTSVPVNLTVVAANVKPTVLISVPANNSKYIAPANINISVTAKDTDGYVANVKLYNGTTLLTTISTPPFDYSWTNVAAGSYSLTAVATDNQGATVTTVPVNISVRMLVAPSVSVTSPTDNSNYISPASILLSATASDPDGTIQRVEFYNNGTLVYTDVTAPYSYTLTNLQPGNYNIMAKAYDDDNLSTTSSVVTIVSAPVKIAPSVALTSPEDQLMVTDPYSITMSANASDPDGTVAYVSFKSNGVEIGKDFTAPYTVIYSSVMAGNYSITATAVDNDSLSTTTAANTVHINHVNQSPAINWISPANNDSGYLGGIINLSVVSNDPDGSVTKVEFYNGSTLLGTALTVPYSINVSLPLGVYILSAKATDNNGAATSKTLNYRVVNVHVYNPIKVSGFKGVIK